MTRLDATSGFQCRSETTQAYNSTKPITWIFPPSCQLFKTRSGTAAPKTSHSPSGLKQTPPIVALGTSPSYSKAPSVKIRTGRCMSSATKVFGRPEHSRSLSTRNAFSWESSSGTLAGDVWPNSRKSARAKRPALPQTCESAYWSFPNTDGIDVGMTNLSLRILTKASSSSSTLEGLFEIATQPSALRLKSNTTPRISELRANGWSFSSEYTKPKRDISPFAHARVEPTCKPWDSIGKSSK